MKKLFIFICLFVSSLIYATTANVFAAAPDSSNCTVGMANCIVENEPAGDNTAYSEDGLKIEHVYHNLTGDNDISVSNFNIANYKYINDAELCKLNSVMVLCIPIDNISKPETTDEVSTLTEKVLFLKEIYDDTEDSAEDRFLGHTLDYINEWEDFFYADNFYKHEGNGGHDVYKRYDSYVRIVTVPLVALLDSDTEMLHWSYNNHKSGVDAKIYDVYKIPTSYFDDDDILEYFDNRLEYLEDTRYNPNLTDVMFTHVLNQSISLIGAIPTAGLVATSADIFYTELAFTAEQNAVYACNELNRLQYIIDAIDYNYPVPDYIVLKIYRNKSHYVEAGYAQLEYTSDPTLSTIDQIAGEIGSMEKSLISNEELLEIIKDYLNAITHSAN